MINSDGGIIYIVPRDASQAVVVHAKVEIDGLAGEVKDIELVIGPPPVVVAVPYQGVAPLRGNFQNEHVLGIPGEFGLCDGTSQRLSRTLQPSGFIATGI